MYYILYEGLKIESNEPVYYTLYTIPIQLLLLSFTFLFYYILLYNT